MKVNKLILPLLAFGLFACKEKPELPSPEPAVITYRKLDENTIVFQNVTKTGYVSKWEFEGRGTSTQNIDTVFFGYAGNYKVKLTSNSKGGLSSTETTVTITQTSKYIAKPVVLAERIDAWHVVVEDQTPESTASSWDFKNGESSTQKKDTVYLPFKGTYKVSLTSVTPFVTSTELSADIVIENDDATYTKCNETMFAFITGGCGDTDGKVWTVDPAPFKTWVGPGGNVSNIQGTAYDRTAGGLTGASHTNGMLKNTFTFTRSNQYIPSTTSITTGGQFSDKVFGNGSHWNEASTDNGSNGTWAAFANVDPNHKQASFVLKTDEWAYIKDKNKSRTTGVTLEVKGGSYIGWYSSNPKYVVVRTNSSAEADTMVLGNYYADEVAAKVEEYGNSRQFTFVSKK